MSTKRSAREILYVVRNVDGGEANKPSVSIRRTATGETTYDVTATGHTIEEAGRKARAEYEALVRWSVRLKEQEKAAREEAQRALLEQSARKT